MHDSGHEHKDKKSRSEKKQAASAKGDEQKSAEEPESGRGPVLPDCDSGRVDRMIEENEEYQEFIEQLSTGSDVGMDQTMRGYLATTRGFIGQEQRQVEMLESGIRRAVEARRKRRGTEMEQGKKVRFAGRGTVKGDADTENGRAGPNGCP